MEYLEFQGFIKDVQYQAFLSDGLFSYNFEEFDINSSATCGKIVLPNGDVAFSKWVSPKRTRSYPFERLYNTYNSPLRITVIPVIKDEGADGDIDKVQYSTISWMNLLNIYVVLAYYDGAKKNARALQVAKNKITDQEFNGEMVNQQILKISQYKQSALHWNRTLMEDSFVNVYRQALNSYEKISRDLGVKVHSRHTQERYLSKVVQDFNMFKDISLRGSKGASFREIKTKHLLEHLSDGSKAIFEITNYLGGTYHLTADEIVYDKPNNIFIIQEAKNSSEGFLPSLSDIKDGLFKLILYSNLDFLKLGTENVAFKTRLKLTGRKVKNSIILPCKQALIDNFLKINQGSFTEKEVITLNKLNLEATNNMKLEIQIAGNQL